MVNKGKAGQAYHMIEQLIVSEELTPGTLVSEAVVMEKTGLGRTPIREALQQLARNRMVEIHPNRGVLIPPASVEAQLRMLEVRRILEALAVRLACQNASAVDRAQMEEMVRRLSSGEPPPLDEYAETLKDTQQMLATACHNEYLADAMAPLQGLSRRFWLARVRGEPDEISRGSAHNLAILRAILARDPDAAEQASLSLNDYLVEFAYRTIRRPSSSP